MLCVTVVTPACWPSYGYSGQSDTVDADEPIGDKDTGDTYALLDMINRQAMQFEFVPPPKVAPQHKATRIADQGTGFYDAGSDGGHVSRYRLARGGIKPLRSI